MEAPKQSATNIKINATIIARDNFPSHSTVVQTGCLLSFCCSLNLKIYDIDIAKCSNINN